MTVGIIHKDTIKPINYFYEEINGILIYNDYSVFKGIKNFTKKYEESSDGINENFNITLIVNKNEIQFQYKKDNNDFSKRYTVKSIEQYIPIIQLSDSFEKVKVNKINKDYNK